MASKILVALPQHGPFSSQKTDDLFSIGYVASQTTNPDTRIKQLEQSVRFLQDQHQIMLSGLHREIETLRRRNRDLQFQLIFPKAGVIVLQRTSPTTSSSSLSSPEGEIRKTISPGQVNVTPLQIELLERDLADLKTNLSASQARNVYLQGVVDEQQRHIQGLKKNNTELVATGKAVTLKEHPANESAENLEEKLDDADRMIRRLRRENEEQRKEIISLRMSGGKNLPRDRQQRQNQASQTSRFPPLHQNSYRNSSKNDRTNRRDGEPTNTTLPLLKERNNGPNQSSSSYHQGGNRRRGYPHHQRGNKTYRNNHRDQQEQED